MPTAVNLIDLGRRVHAVRMARRLTLEQVVARAKFTVSWLSKLENGQLTPSLDGLVKLAKVLDCGVEAFVVGLSVPPQYVVVRQGAGLIDPVRDDQSGYVVERLAEQWRDRAMNPSIIRLSGVGNRKRPDNHDGERFLLVLEGAATLEYGSELIYLDTGDSIYIYAAIAHILTPNGPGPAKILSVSYDPKPERTAADGSHARRGEGRPRKAASKAPARTKDAKPSQD